MTDVPAPEEHVRAAFAALEVGDRYRVAIRGRAIGFPTRVRLRPERDRP
jgi:hypothetical protein